MDTELARKLFDYNPETGVMVWKERINNQSRVEIGAEAGYLRKVRSNRHRHVMVSGISYSAHRLIWLIVYGKFPDGQIDHINGIQNDNRLVNLRDVAPIENSRNRAISHDNKSGVSGVYLRKSKKWRSFIHVKSKVIHLGTFADWWDAVCSRKAAEFQYGFRVNHGRVA